MLFAIVLAALTAAQQTTPALFEKLAGKWVLTGTLAGKQVVHDVDADLVLNHEYVRLHEVSREKDKDGKPNYEAIIFVTADPKSGEFTVMWLDNTEAVADFSSAVIGRAKPSQNSIPFIFKFKNAGEFHTTWIYSPDTDTWQWVMDNVPSSGKVEPFARLTMTRRP